MLLLIKLYLKYSYIFLVLLLFGISILPDEVEFSIKSRGYVEFHALHNSAIAGNGKYNDHGLGCNDCSNAPSPVKIIFLNGECPEKMALLCDYKPKTFTLCSDLIYRKQGIFAYKMKREDFLSSYQPKVMPSVSVSGQQIQICTRKNGNIFYPQKEQIRKNFSFIGIGISKRAVLMLAVLFSLYATAIFALWLWRKKLPDPLVPNKKQVFHALLWMLFFTSLNILAFGFNMIRLPLRIPAFFMVPMLIEVLLTPFLQNKEKAPEQIVSPLPKHTICFDVLRILSAFFVVLIHVGVYSLRSIVPSSPDGVCADILIITARFAVPVFFMLSGALMLPPKKRISLKKLYTEKIWRLLLCFCIWSWIESAISGQTAGSLFFNLANYPDQFWFLPVLIGLYILLPVLKPVAADRKLVLYLLIIGFIFTFCLPMLLGKIAPLAVFQKVFAAKYLRYLYPIVYFLAGYFLSAQKLSSRSRKWIYTFGGISFLFVILCSEWMSFHQISAKFLHSAGSPMIFLFSTAVFIGVKEFCEKKSAFFERFYRPIVSLAKLTFGIYLVHCIFIDMLAAYVFAWQFPFCRTILTLFFTVLVFMISAAFTALLQKIPWVKNHLV